MAGLVGVILVLMALFSVGAVLFMVMREHPEQEEWYVPPEFDGSIGSTTSPMSTAEIVGTMGSDPLPANENPTVHNAD